MNKLSVIIITKNEEANIRKCLDSVKWADEIVLVDQSSSDRTVEIAKEFTDKIFVTSEKLCCEPDRMFAISKATHEWILYLDADEQATPELEKEIRQVLSKPQEEFSNYFIARKTYFLGKWIRNCGWYPAYVVRLFKKGSINFSSSIHHDGDLSGKPGYLKANLSHYSYNTLAQYFEKFNRFTTVMAQDKYQKGKRFKRSNFLFYFLIHPFYAFIRKFFILKGFRDGFHGFFISFSSGLVIFVVYAKLWEIQQRDKK